jgi:hypothetical protein
MASAAELRAVGTALAADAGWLPVALDIVVRSSGPSVWRGPAADRFAAGLSDRQRALRAAADEMQAVSRQCLSQADTLEASETLPIERIPAGAVAPLRRYGAG